MSHRLIPLLLVCLIAGAAQAQSSGGPGGGHGHRGGRGSGSAPSGDTAAAKPAPPPKRETPPNQVDIFGVVKSLGPDPDRVTITYDAVEPLGWPAGTNTFVVFRTAMLKDVTVGEKVRFRIDSLEISELKPFCGPPGGAAPGGPSAQPGCPAAESPSPAH
jgi:Cu/Ag efflux protein CusF